MKKIKFLFLLLLAACSGPTQQPQLTYPESKKVDHIDTYFDTQVEDPYRWLEDDNSQETSDWVAKQNEVTFSYLEKIPFREEIRKRLERLLDYERVSAPSKEGEYYYFNKNNGLQNQSILYRKPTLDGEAELFLDPNTLSEDGTVSLGGTSFSHDAQYFAYAISVSGSDWREIYVMDVASKQKLNDKVEWAKFTGMSWYKDGFYYQRFPTPKEGEAMKSENQFGKIYYHKVGTDQSQDQLIYENTENPNNRFFAWVSNDERYLVIYSSESTSGNGLSIKDLTKPNSNFVTLVDNFDNDHSVIGTEGERILLETNLDAPNNRVVELTLENPTPSGWTDVIPESTNVLNSAMAGGKIFGSYLVDAKTEVKQFDSKGNLERAVTLPGLGSAFGFNGRPEDTELFYTFTSFLTPGTIYKYDIASGESVEYDSPKVDFDPNDFETSQVFYESKDGTKVPMFIVHKKGMELNGKNPTWLYSYGGFNISMTPGFSPYRLLWLENGGIYAQPSIRGGGEYGEEWHKAGTKMHKQNVFDDFIAAGDYLVENNYTSHEYLVVQGGSNGGLLIGATINQRPDLAKVAFPQVGVMDMLRYQNFTIGRAWATDYGTSEDSKEMFEYLKGYSPLHNIKEGVEYPAVIVTTADHDDRVVPAHSFKYGATLQAKAGSGPNPILIRIETKAGHGGGTPTSKRIEQYADLYSFAYYNLGIIPEKSKTKL